MMHGEFEELSGIEISWERYHNVIEPMYIAADVDKREFIKMINLDYFNERSFERYAILRKNTEADTDGHWHVCHFMIANSPKRALEDYYFLLDELGQADPVWTYQAVPEKSIQGDVYSDDCSNN